MALVHGISSVEGIQFFKDRIFFSGFQCFHFEPKTTKKTHIACKFTQESNSKFINSVNFNKIYPLLLTVRLSAGTINEEFGVNFFSSNGLTAPWGHRPPHFSRLHDHTLFKHTTLGRTPLDEGPARRRDLYLTTHNTHNRQTSMP
jgi:hypothetical protein